MIERIVHQLAQANENFTVNVLRTILQQTRTKNKDAFIKSKVL